LIGEKKNLRRKPYYDCQSRLQINNNIKLEEFSKAFDNIAPALINTAVARKEAMPALVTHTLSIAVVCRQRRLGAMPRGGEEGRAVRATLRKKTRWGAMAGGEREKSATSATAGGRSMEATEHMHGSVRRLLVSCAALALTLGPASAVHAFVPIRGCGEPGSNYDTKIVSAAADEGARSASTSSAGCTKLYQPARAAELRATVRHDTDSSADGGGAAVRGRTTTDELGSNDSN